MSARDILPFQASVTFFRCRVLGDLFESFSSGEIVIEFHHEPIAEIPGRQVVVLDVVRNRSCLRATPSLHSPFGEPLPVGFHLLAGIYRRHRRRNPSRFQGIGRVCPGADLTEPELLAGLDDGRPDFLAFLMRTPDFKARRSGHAVTQSADFTSGDGDFAHIEELDLGNRSPFSLFRT